MIQVNIHKAKTNLSQLLQVVAQGEEVIIAKAGKPVARLSGLSTTAAKRQFDKDRGLFQVPDDFDQPLPPETLEEFEA